MDTPGGLHQRTHRNPVDGCFGCKAMSLTISGVSPTVSKGFGRSDRTGEIKMQKELALYREARAQGIQPKSTQTKDIRRAIDRSNQVGKAWDATSNAFVG